MHLLRTTVFDFFSYGGIQPMEIVGILPFNTLPPCYNCQYVYKFWVYLSL